MIYGIRKAPPPFSRAVKGKRQTLPRPMDMAMQDIRNSTPFPQVARSLTDVYKKKSKEGKMKNTIKVLNRCRKKPLTL